ncbi:MAG: TolC family protein [Bacteroidia bacterium]|nr:TolC family protein [Bacteroidia bacterium]
MNYYLINHKKMLYRVVLIFLIIFEAHAQSVLTIDEAIKTGLEKNYAVQIVRNNQTIAKAQNNLGNAGMSPTVSLNAGINLANQNTHLEFNTGTIQDKAGAQSNNVSASINAGWIIFDGLKMFDIKKRLGLNEDLSSLQLKQQMENTIYDIVASYYDVVRISELIKSAKQNLSIYEERLKIAQLKYEIGSDSKVDVMLSQIETNKVKSSILQLEVQLLNSKSKLNTLLNQSVDTEFNVADSITINYQPNLDELKKNLISSNTSLLASKQVELISQQSIKEVRANNLPFIQLNAAYNFTRAQSQTGILLLNQQLGLNTGLTASWLIFNGNKNNKLMKERNLMYLNQKYATDQMKLQLDAMVYNSYQAYLRNKQIVELENRNLSDSKDLITVSLERYKIGKSNLLETIETQKNLEDAQVRYIQALYNMKLAETDLLKSNGLLIK